jgi:hypothetical protein
MLVGQQGGSSGYETCSIEFRRAIRKAVHKAAFILDRWHGMAPTNQMVTEFRQRRAHNLHGKRGSAKVINTPCPLLAR